MRPLRVGLTGGIASGKTSVARMFAELGVPVIDTDEIARELVRSGQPALAEITAAFGRDCLDAAGELDRAWLRQRVFSDDDARRRLEGILHPRIEAEMLAASARAGGPYQVLVVPLLFESGFARHVDRVLVVDCPPELQEARLAARDGASTEQARRILGTQLGRKERLSAADDVLINDAGLDKARVRVRELHAGYLECARQPGRPER